MICRFCAQWNPEGTARCGFCDNPVDAEEDRTIAGTPDYLRNTGTSMPAALPSMFDDQARRSDVDRLLDGIGHALAGLSPSQRKFLAAAALGGIIVLLMLCAT